VLRYHCIATFLPALTKISHRWITPSLHSSIGESTEHTGPLPSRAATIPLFSSESEHHMEIWVATTSSVIYLGQRGQSRDGTKWVTHRFTRCRSWRRRRTSSFALQPVLPDDDPVMSSQSPVQMAMVTSRAYTLACWRHRSRHLHVAVPSAAGANAAATRAAYVHGAANI
jgi:hypothetical protein